MAEVTLKAERREVQKNDAKKMRRDGIIPGVYYVHGQEPVHVKVTVNDIKPIVYTSETRIAKLQIEGEEDRECILKEVTFDPVSDKILHFDLLGITRGETLQLEIPISLIGKPIGVKAGGVLQHSLFRIDIECLPKDIPEHIEVDVSHLEMGDAIKISDLNIDNITILNAEDSIVASIVAPRSEVEEEEEDLLASDEESAEPEVIGKGKSEEEEEEE